MKSDDDKTAQNSGETATASSDRAEHLRPHQFQPGQTGNPGGRPRTKLFRKALIALLADTEDEASPSERLRKIAARLTDAAEKGDIRAAEFLRDCVDGKPTADDAQDSGPQIVFAPVFFDGPPPEPEDEQK
jgi:hypothetical protein